jgi:formylglycine-generating enzyme
MAEGKACCAPAREAGALPAAGFVLPGAMGAPFAAIAVKGGRGFVGTDRPQIVGDGEAPRRAVTLRDFRLEAQAVTNARFAAFVAATGYVTEAERFGWSAVFRGLLPQGGVPVGELASAPWWLRVDGAQWRSPEGPGSDIAGRMDHPVVQVSWADAQAFATWVGGRLPSEAEWEHAAGSGDGRRFVWGEAEPSDSEIYCNIWQGQFPNLNSCVDGYLGTAPARSFAASEQGFYNLLGNVWEWTSDAFRLRSVSGMAKARNLAAQRQSEKVLKGGSFLCHISYCYRYRIAARMALTPDSATSNAGFRVAYDAVR